MLLITATDDTCKSNATQKRNSILVSQSLATKGIESHGASETPTEELNKAYLPIFILTDFAFFHLQVIDEWEAGFPKIDARAADTERLEQLLEAHYKPQRVVF